MSGSVKGRGTRGAPKNAPQGRGLAMVERVESDVVQIGYAIMAQVPGRFALSQVTALPFLVDVEDADEASAALWRLYETGMLETDYEDIVPLFFGLSKQTEFHFSRPPASVDDLNGLRVRIFSEYHTPRAEALGIVPSSIPAGDQYVALQRGTVDGTLTSWSTVPTYNLQEVTSYHLEVPLGGSVLFAFMSRDRYEALSEEARAAIDANSGEAPSRASGIQLKGDSQKGRQLAADRGNTIVQLSDEQLEAWRESVGEPWLNAWLPRSFRTALIVPILYCRIHPWQRPVPNKHPSHVDQH